MTHRKGPGGRGRFSLPLFVVPFLLSIFLLWTAGCADASRIPSIVPDFTGERFERLLQDANLNYSREDYNGAIRDYTLALELREECADCYFGRGLARIKLTDYDGAFADFEQAIRHNYNEIWWVYFSRGVVCEKMEQYSCAASDYIDVTISKPDFWSAYMSPRLIDIKEKDYNDCVQAYLEVIRLEKSEKSRPIYYQNSAICKLQLGHYKEAVDAAGKALQLDPNLDRVYRIRARAREEGFHDHEGALEDLTRALLLKPESGRGYYLRGQLYMNSFRDLQHACEDFKKAGLFGIFEGREIFERKCIPPEEEKKGEGTQGEGEAKGTDAEKPPQREAKDGKDTGGAENSSGNPFPGLAETPSRE